MKALTLDKPELQKSLRISNSPLSNKFLFVKTLDAIHVLEKKSISHLQAQGNYTLIFTNGRKICSSKTLKFYEQLLKGKYFIRTHQSFLVNIFYVEHFHYGACSEFKLLSGENIPVSRSKKAAILSSFNNLQGI